ncbi:MAG: SUMF1/EgtB/PvdO family nonheme iron enzyme [Proteobacteria bacterium]|nr:SUMF1/EgtB/PvdO family nonheme iron enzyme [Pseudomonadota bacterium]
MAYVKILAELTLIGLIAWIIADPGFDLAPVVVIAISALVSAFLAEKRNTRCAQLYQSVSQPSKRKFFICLGMLLFAGATGAWASSPQIATGVWHTVAIKGDGTLWSWGHNGDGQLGDGTQTLYRNIPIQIGTGTNWSAVAAGGRHTMAIKDDGTLWVWGYNGYGQLGDGTQTDKNTPVQIGTGTNWSAVTAGAFHTVAIKGDGTLWAWGYNDDGQLGNGTQTDRNTPVQIGVDTNWSAVAAGASHTVAIKGDGTLWAWGSNGSGQLGDGTSTDRITPVQIGVDTNWSAVAAAIWSDHTVAIKGDGTLWAWGYYNGYNLGYPIFSTFRYAPVRIGSDTNWSAVKTGTSYTVAIKSNGTLWAWGENDLGQLGDGTLTDRITPVQIGVDTNWSALAAGSYHTVAIRGNGTLWAWGGNDWGQLGDRTWANKNMPVFILTGPADTTAPTTTATPAGGTYTSAQSVTLTCSDGAGAGCDKIYYTTDGTEPSIASPVYFGPINISANTTLKFFAKDLTENSEMVKTEKYAINYPGDIDGNRDINLNDAILALQIISNIERTGQIFTAGEDVNGDGKIGLQEVIYILQKAAGLRTEAPGTYSISGTITSGGTGLSGVTVTLYVVASQSFKSFTTGADGTYIFTHLANGSYTFAATKAGYTFTPQMVPVNGSNMTQDFNGTLSTATAEMVLIPAGSFQMGDAIDGMSDAVPVHTVTVSAFYIDKYEVTKALWDEVYTWATSHGYTFNNAGYSTAMNHPVHDVSWYDVIKWLNARSEKEVRTPVYYTDVAQTTIYKTGQVDVTNGMVKWTTNGYRLPTEAEWEYAARAGTTTRFYTGDCISTDQANYDGNHPWGGCATGQSREWTTAVGSFAANPWGLNDLVGNVWEWVWDWYGNYSSSAAANPKGPDSGSDRMVRGGGWGNFAGYLRSAGRLNLGASSDWCCDLGFRSALSQP